MSCRIGLPGLGRVGVGEGSSTLMRKACRSGTVGNKSSYKVSFRFEYTRPVALTLSSSSIACSAWRSQCSRFKSAPSPEKRDWGISLEARQETYLLRLQILSRDIYRHDVTRLLAGDQVKAYTVISSYYYTAVRVSREPDNLTESISAGGFFQKLTFCPAGLPNIHTSYSPCR
jgi:hypothetical protein